MTEALRPDCPDRSRREFLKTLGTATLSSTFRLDDTTAAAAVTTILKTPRETAVSRFYRSLTDLQKAQICFPAHHPLRTRVHPNWAIVKPTIGDLPPKQKALCADVFHDLCSEDGRKRFLRQMDEDYGGFENYHVAIFGEPDTDQPFEWVLSGRHATLRADGNRIDGLPFTGPIFYGHASPDHHDNSTQKGNVWRFQAECARELCTTLNETQRAVANESRSVKDGDSLIASLDPGLCPRDLYRYQVNKVRDLIEAILLPFGGSEKTLRRTIDIDDCYFLNDLRFRIYLQGSNENILADVWTLETPFLSCTFHGSPHVHVWLNVNAQVTSI